MCHHLGTDDRILGKQYVDLVSVLVIVYTRQAVDLVADCLPWFRLLGRHCGGPPLVGPRLVIASGSYALLQCLNALSSRLSVTVYSCMGMTAVGILQRCRYTQYSDGTERQLAFQPLRLP